MANKYQMVTEVVPEAYRADIPAPSITVNIFSPDIEAGFYAEKAAECLNKGNSMDCVQQIGEATESIFNLDPNLQNLNNGNDI